MNGVGGGQATDAFGFTNGGSITTPSSLIPYFATVPGGSFANPGTGGNGGSGYQIIKPLMWTGGAGGGGATVRGGDGGNGSIGCGGGGSGATQGSPSGAAGRGGNGIVIITSYSI
jgi:hypothetical protein